MASPSSTTSTIGTPASKVWLAAMLAVLGFTAHAQNGASAQGVTLTPLDPALVDASRSISANTPAQVNFVNQSSNAVDIYWITYDGKRMLYRGNLTPGSSWKAGTFLTHPWLVVASGTGGNAESGTGVRLAGFEALTSNGDTAFITGVPGTGMPTRHVQDTAPARDVASAAQGVALTALDAAMTDDTLRSANGTTPAQITFVNQGGTAVDIYWITYEGKRMLYQSKLEPGASWRVGTFLTHPWLVVASGTGGTAERDTGVRIAGFEALTPNGDTALIH